MEKTSRRLIFLALIIVLSDSLGTYFLRTIADISFPVNAFLPVLLLATVAISGFHIIRIPSVCWFFLVLGVLGFIFGIALIQDVSIRRLLSIGAALSAFFVGYVSVRWSTDDSPYFWILMYISFLYVVVCILALTGVNPNLFPVINAAWSDGRQVHLRPEIMVDQNFQVFYLFPLVALLPSVRGWFSFVVVILGTLGAFYIMARLQTRSGFVVLTGVLVFGWIAKLWSDRKIEWQLALVPIFLVSFMGIFADEIFDAAKLLILRMENAGSGGLGRLDSTLYLFPKLLDLYWWIPQGNTAFIQSHGDLPHSNATAMYMEGGMLSFLMWVSIFLYPLLKLFWAFVKRRLDSLGVLILSCGLAAMVTQFSLNVPFYEQVWFWAGCVIAALQRSGIQMKKRPDISTDKNNIFISGS